jgi:phenylalanyl-tRNA synthetase beta subunit
MTKKADPTIKALNEGLKELGAAKGVKNVDSWLEALEKEEFRGAKTIHTNLEKLKKLLGADPLDSEAIGKLLHTLGGETKRAGSHEESAHNKKIVELGELLEKVGSAPESK